ncbi:MAG TPA: hypothetical protein VJX31_07470 [Casimicrobiaceae bacterium]|nr:hypothetical protein [Casimicrobiaceae bacterium]
MIPGRGGFLPPSQRFVEGRVVGCPRELDGARFGEESRFVDERLDARLHKIRADVEKQQQTTKQKKDDDQQDRDEPDEHVGERQLAADTPQKPLRHGSGLLVVHRSRNIPARSIVARSGTAVEGLSWAAVDQLIHATKSLRSIDMLFLP